VRTNADQPEAMLSTAIHAMGGRVCISSDECMNNCLLVEACCGLHPPTRSMVELKKLFEYKE
jgi:hypothetical protein